MTIKTYQQGTHRVCSPQTTYEKITPWLKDMGITRVANITGLDRIGVPVVTVCRPDSCAISVAQGKGLDLISAKVSGIMEAIETFHGEHMTLPLRLASYDQLKTDQLKTDQVSESPAVIDVHALPKLSFSSFSEHTRLLWVEGNELISKQPMFVPYEVVHCNYTLPLPAGSGAFMMNTNGLASGNTAEEAVVHGLCEVIERDALALWSVEQQYAPEIAETRRVNLNAIDDPACRQILDQFAQADMQVKVWDIRSDIQLPGFFCSLVANTPTHGPAYSSSGSGTHPCKEIALLRALTEAAQTRLTMISGSRDDIEANDYRHQDYSDAMNQSPDPALILRSFADIPSWSHDSFEADIDFILHQLQQAGVSQVVTVNLEKAPYHIPVIRVVVPLLEGIHGSPGYIMGQRAIAYRQSLANGQAVTKGARQ